MPDVYVFPGGVVMEEDRAIEVELQLCLSVAETAADPEGRTRLGNGLRVAALRELFEEANVLLAYTTDQKMLAVDGQTLARFASYRHLLHQQQGSMKELLTNEQLVLATEQLHYFSHWITPEASPRRYDTHFFLAKAPGAQEAIYDQLETSDGIWVAPGEALKRYEAGTFNLAFPTIYQLRELEVFPTVQAALVAADQHYVKTQRPVMVEKDGQTQIIMPE
ncbi:NUDIX hydrolase [Dictyobacter kobayashii]|uniref:NUDIX hydrolase n=2 Tax=Dictyobacter kobayashii TaxID=2014872 RepID=A0A402AGA6_9CHLR|nr:NUDIX hydrolase [Dictyobacter kobayashii]